MKQIYDLRRASLAASISAILAVCSYALYMHRDALFWHLDGYMFRQLIEDQFQWLPASLALGLDPLRGPGNVFFPVNFRFLPIVFIQTIFFAGHISRVATYLAYGIQTTLVMCLLARYCGLPARVGMLAGYILLLLTMPLIWTQQTTLGFPLFLLAPIAFDLLAFVVLFFVAYGHIGRGSIAGAVCLSVLCAVMTFFALAVGPLWCVLAAPFLGVAVLSYILTASGSERVAKSLAISAIIAFLYLSGAIEFARSTVESGALRIFGFEIESYQYGRWWSSMLYQFDRFPFGAATAAIGILVAFTNIRATTSRNANAARRTAALLTVALGIVFLFAWGIIDRFEVLADQLRHVRLFYFELPLLPFYAMFAAVGISQGLQIVASRCPMPQLTEDGAVALTIAVLVLPRLHNIRDTNPYSQPATATQITTLLKTEIGITPGSLFRGRVATIFSGSDSSDTPANWDRMVAHDVARYRAQQNDHRFVGLWAFQIPTLQEYSQMLTPGMYFWITRGMSIASDVQDMRNTAIITQPNAPLMKLFGVRFVVSPQPIRDPEFAQRASTPAGDFLYEIANVNTGQYYARHVEHAGSFPEMLHSMHTTTSLLDTTWVYESLGSALSPGRVDIAFERSGIRVRGSSDGTSLILLPFTFTHCFAIKVNSGDRKPGIVRANLNMLGLVFRGSVDATLALETGPLTRPGCLAVDTRELQQLGIDQAAREFPRGALVSPN